jgi:hypothetical protein
MASGMATKKRVLVVADDLGLGVRIRDVLKVEHDVLVVSWPQLALDLLKIGARWDRIICEPHPKGLGTAEFRRAVSRIEPDQADRISVLGRTTDSGILECMAG